MMSSGRPNGDDPIKVIHEQQKSDRRFEAVKLKLTWGTVSGKWWGPTNQQPILCFHGWQDNCCVFDRLIPMLPKEFSYLTLDIPGHGFSDSYPIGMHYGSLDMLWFVENIRRVYGWKKISIIAHSMMAGVVYYYAALFPERTNFVVALDNLRSFDIVEIDVYLRNIIDKLHLEDERIRHGQEPPSYDYEELVEKIYVGSFESVNRENCKYLLARGVQESTKFPSKYYFNRDARVKHFNNFLCDQRAYIKMAENINMPFLLLVGSNSINNREGNNTFQIARALEKHNPKFQLEIVPGNHHFFLNDPDMCHRTIEQFLYSANPAKNKL